MIFNTDTQVLEEVELKEKTQKELNVVLYNDDVNTFDHVIESLVKICDHTWEQAEQCAILVHYKGQCTVKTGELTKLKPQCASLQDAGLSAEII